MTFFNQVEAEIMCERVEGMVMSDYDLIPDDIFTDLAMKNMCERVRKLFEKHKGEYRHFERVSLPLSNRPDMHALKCLDSLFPTEPGESVMIGEVCNEGIYFELTKEQISLLSEGQVINLTRCGVIYDEERKLLMMYV
ncbi:MAG: hypothetical protein GY799_25185 [Desulfobulbaceae bacterium]|nr:hypothetical protein [Desulfobulbaceae bacterium]